MNCVARSCHPGGPWGFRWSLRCKSLRLFFPDCSRRDLQGLHHRWLILRLRGCVCVVSTICRVQLVSRESHFVIGAGQPRAMTTVTAQEQDFACHESLGSGVSQPRRRLMMSVTRKRPVYSLDLGRHRGQADQGNSCRMTCDVARQARYSSKP